MNLSVRTSPPAARLLAQLLCTLAVVASAPALAVCRIEPFANDGAGRRAADALSQGCAGPQWNWGMEAPQEHVMRTRVDSSFGQRLSPSLESALRVSWVGRGDGIAGQMQTEQAFLATALRWRLDRQLALNLRMGQELFGAFRERLALAGLWQPTPRAAFFAEWSATPAGTESNQLGLRWWLLGRWLSVEAGARYRPDGAGWGDEQVRLQMELRPWDRRP